MALLCLDEICNKISSGHPEIEEPLFALYYAPVLAREKKYEQLDALTKVNPYAALFKYPTAIQMKAQNVCGHDFKDFLKNVIIDSRAFENYSEISEAIHQFASTTISNTRKYQQENGILENAIVSYCPIVPYSQALKVAENANTSIVSDVVLDFPKLYADCLESKDNQIKILRHLASRAPLVIIDTAGYYATGTGVANIYQDLKWQDEKMQLALMYWGLISLLTLDEKPQHTDVANVWSSMASLWSTTPAEKAAFENVYGALLKDTAAFVSTEGWDSIPDSHSSPIEEPYAKHDTTCFDIDKLVSQFHARRNVITSPGTTTYVESEWQNAGITDITAFTDEITLITFGNTWIGIPFVDVPDDYTIKVMCINQDGDIQDFASPPCTSND